MYYKLSNAASRETIEDTFGVEFKYPKLYTENQIINGLQESVLPVIILEEPQRVNFAIWGLLPDGFKEDWFVIQNQINTLNIPVSLLKSDLWITEDFESRRCLIIATGFFTALLHEGELYPYHVCLPDRTPFSIAGIYSRLEDGFLSCSILIRKIDVGLQKFQHMCKEMPCVLTEAQSKQWLNGHDGEKNLLDILEASSTPALEFKPIAKEFFKHDIQFDTVLESVVYKDVPMPK